jgi:hypothetical protein
MNFAAVSDILKNLFGDKPWYTSLTAIGLLVFAFAEQLFNTLCFDLGLISAETCFSITPWVEKAGVVLTALGLRRKLNPPAA